MYAFWTDKHSAIINEVIQKVVKGFKLLNRKNKVIEETGKKTNLNISIEKRKNKQLKKINHLFRIVRVFFNNKKTKLVYITTT